jgi:hypothetical protein
MNQQSEVAMSEHLADDLLSTTAGGWRSFYNQLSRRLEDIGVADSSFFLNYGYVPTTSDNESAFAIREGTFNAHSVRLVLEVIGPIDLDDRTVVEIGCGRGGKVQRSGHRHRHVLGGDRFLPQNTRRQFDGFQGGRCTEYPPGRWLLRCRPQCGVVTLIWESAKVPGRSSPDLPARGMVFAHRLLEP